MKVDLRDVIEAIEFEGDLVRHYYNKISGIIIGIEDSSASTYKASFAKELDKFEDWEKELIGNLVDFEENPENYIPLPSKEEINEYGMLVDFCNSLEDSDLKNKILESNESFLKLKQSIESNGLLSQWYDYREVRERELAISWCKDNNIEYSF